MLRRKLVLWLLLAVFFQAQAIQPSGLMPGPLFSDGVLFVLCPGNLASAQVIKLSGKQRHSHHHSSHHPSSHHIQSESCDFSLPGAGYFPAVTLLLPQQLYTGNNPAAPFPAPVSRVISFFTPIYRGPPVVTNIT